MFAPSGVQARSSFQMACSIDALGAPGIIGCTTVLNPPDIATQDPSGGAKTLPQCPRGREMSAVDVCFPVSTSVTISSAFGPMVASLRPGFTKAGADPRLG